MSKAVRDWRRRLNAYETDAGVEAAYMRFVLTEKRDEFVSLMDDGGCDSCSAEFKWDDVGAALGICLSHNEWWQEFEAFTVKEIEYEIYQNAG